MGVIFAKTPKGQEEVATKSAGLTPRVRRVLIMVDGKRQSARESRVNGNSGYEQSFVPPAAAIERIEVVRGPMSSLYGSDAMGGVINIITRKIAPTWRGSANTSYTLSEESERGDAYQLGVNVAGPITENLGLRLGATYARTNPDEVNIAAALVGPDGRPCGAIVVSAPLHSWSVERLEKEVAPLLLAQVRESFAFL